jgi:molybdenum cofactor biosynthesis enzyme MoaA
MALDLKRKFCNVPFRNFEVIHTGEVSSCCWVAPKHGSYPDRYVLGSLAHQSVDEIWNGKPAKELRRSILDGSFEFCSQDICPLFRDDGAGLIDKDQVSEVRQDMFDGINDEERKCIEQGSTTCDNLPSKLYLNLGYSCNYNCPTCAPSQDEHSAFNKVVDYLETRNSFFLEKLSSVFLKVRYIFLGSFGEPLYSKSLVRWLRGFRPENFSEDFFMELQTNGSLLNETFWSGLPIELKKHLSMIQVSTDAATKDTYEKVRLGGKWEVIKRNLEFISKLNTVKSLTLNFVVQESNFREMEAFVDLGAHLGCRVRFTRVQRWPATSAEVFAKMNVFDPDHVSHSEFVKIVGSEKLKDRRVDMRELIDILNGTDARQSTRNLNSEMPATVLSPGIERKILSLKGQERITKWPL